MPECLDLINAITQAKKRIAPFVRETYLQHSPFYSELTGANVYFKCENMQLTGSFKLRGALNKYLSLTDSERARGIVAASTGNHGKAVVFASRVANPQNNRRCTIFAPTDADPIKLGAIRSIGANVQMSGDDCVEAEIRAREFAEEHSQTYISPYNDPNVIAGQGTIGFEICEQLGKIDAVIGSVGGGGMLAGIASFVTNQFPDCQIIGCSPENSNVMIQSLAAGQLLDVPSSDTLSDGTAGGVEAGSVTFDLCKRLFTQTVSVTESKIAENLIQFIDAEGMLIEGAAAVAIAGLLRERDRLAGKNVVVVLCGGNISTIRLSKVVADVKPNTQNGA